MNINSTPKIAQGNQNGNQTQNQVSHSGLLVNLIIKKTNQVINPIVPKGKEQDTLTFAGLVSL